MDAEAFDPTMRGPSMPAVGVASGSRVGTIVGSTAEEEAVAVLLAVEGSASVADAVADAVRVPADRGRTTMVNVRLAPVGHVAEREGQLAIARRDAAGGRDEGRAGRERLGQCRVRGRRPGRG